MTEGDRLLVTKHDHPHDHPKGSVTLHEACAAAEGFSISLRPCVEHIEALREAADILEAAMESEI